MLCSTIYDTKLQLQLHEMKCGVPQKDYPDYRVMREFYDNSLNILCEVDNNIIVRSNNETYVGKHVTQYKNIFKNDNVCIM